MLKILSCRLLGLLGWTLSEPPQRPARAVLIAYPHTSNCAEMAAEMTSEE